MTCLGRGRVDVVRSLGSRCSGRFGQRPPQGGEVGHRRRTSFPTVAAVLDPVARWPIRCLPSEATFRDPPIRIGGSGKCPSVPRAFLFRVFYGLEARDSGRLGLRRRKPVCRDSILHICARVWPHRQGAIPAWFPSVSSLQIFLRAAGSRGLLPERAVPITVSGRGVGGSSRHRGNAVDSGAGCCYGGSSRLADKPSGISATKARAFRKPLLFLQPVGSGWD